MTNASANAADLLKVLTRLIEVLQQETHFLRQMRPQDMQSLQQDKIVLIAAYESQLARFHAAPEEAQALPSELRARIMDVTSAFQTTLTENARALFAVKEANERLFKLVVKAIEEKRADTRFYAPDGGLAQALPAAIPRPVSIALDQRL